MKDFIKQQQELAKSKGYRHVDGSDTLPEWYSYSKEDLDTLITQIITNTGEELMLEIHRLRTKVECQEDIGWNNCLDTLKKHITNVTGVE